MRQKLSKDKVTVVCCFFAFSVSWILQTRTVVRLCLVVQSAKSALCIVLSVGRVSNFFKNLKKQTDYITSMHTRMLNKSGGERCVLILSKVMVAYQNSESGRIPS